VRPAHHATPWARRGRVGAQAHARLLARQVVTRQDAVVAVMLAEESLLTSAVLGERMDLRAADFPADPDAEHAEREARLLDALRSVTGDVPGGAALALL